MAINKPTKPDVTLPEKFGGIKTPYTDSQIESGYEDGIPQIVDGGNINYEKDATFKKLDYIEKIADVINNIPAGNYLGVDTNNKFQYYDASIRNSYGNIGDVQYTIRTDLPYGGAWCDGTMYTKAELPDLYTMLLEGNLLVKTLDEYNALVTTNGSCGFFGLDEVNERFKVPTYKDVYLKVGETNLAEFSAESLPNITGQYNRQCLMNNTAGTESGALYTGSGIDSQLAGGTSGGTTSTIAFNASRSSSTYKDGAKVNPDHICYRAYVVVYTAIEDATEATWNLKANDREVIHNTGNEEFSGTKTAIVSTQKYRTNFSEKIDVNQTLSPYKIEDSNLVTIGADYIIKQNDGSVRRCWRAEQNTGENAGKYCGIVSLVNEDGTTRMYYSSNGKISIPDTGSSIPTMDKLNSRISAIMDSSGKGSGWINLNGVLVQWGTTTGGVETTFKKPFSNTNYSLVVGETSGHKYSDGSYITQKTTTNFKYGANICWIAIGY